MAQAGRFGAVTIATNMAGRGTDIILGGVPDHRVKAILARAGDRPRAGDARSSAQAALDQALAEMARDYKKALAERKDDAPRSGSTLAKRYLGLLAALLARPPLGAGGGRLRRGGLPAPRAYLDAARDLPRRDQGEDRQALLPADRGPGGLPRRPSPEGATSTRSRRPRSSRRSRSSWTSNERERVVALGGLHILATERHEARRIDNQLRGRAGRQGDPGSSRFYLSLQDDLMRIFGSDRISGLMLKLGMEEGVPIEHGMVTKSIERAQKQVEAQNFAVRKHLLEYDDVMNKQRTAVYDMRRMILEGKDTREHVLEPGPGGRSTGTSTTTATRRQDPGSWNLEGLQIALKETFGLDAPLAELRTMGRAEMARAASRTRIAPSYEEKERTVGPELMLFHQRMIMLQIVDTQWKDHLYSPRPPEGGHRPARLRPARPPRRVQEGVVQRCSRRSWTGSTRRSCAGSSSTSRSSRGADPRRRPSRTRDPSVPCSAATSTGPLRPARVREPELALAGARALPRQPELQRPLRDAQSAFARAAQPREAQGGTRRGADRAPRRARRSAATIPAPAAAGRSTRSATGWAECSRTGCRRR